MNIMGMMKKFMNDPLLKSNYKPDKIQGLSKPKAVKDHIRRTQQNRNELCDCGSGKKFKNCHGKVIN